MASMTLAEARTNVLELLDDNNTRWSSAVIDTALSFALNACQNDYVRAGGLRLSEVVSISTSAGSASLATYNPISVASVAYINGSLAVPLRQARATDYGHDDADSRTLRVELTRTLALPTTTTHPLIGIGSTEVNSVPILAEWVCARAARKLKVKDDEASQALENLIADAAKAAVGAPDTQGFREFSSAQACNVRNFLRWYYEPRSQYLKLTVDAMTW